VRVEILRLAVVLAGSQSGNWGADYIRAEHRLRALPENAPDGIMQAYSFSVIGGRQHKLTWPPPGVQRDT
jgi:hypothetical protein